VIESDAFARGLAKRFMNEMDLLDSPEILLRALSRINRARSKTRWIKEIRNLENALGHILLASRMIGTERNPVWVGTAMGKGKTSVYNHDENVLEVFALAIPLRLTSNTESVGSYAEIGEHAIKRIIQRFGQSESYRYDATAILDEIRSAMNLVSLLAMLTSGARYSRIVYPKIPAKNGIFRGQIIPQSGNIISLRTYIPYALSPRESDSEIEVIGHLFSGHERIPFFAFTAVDSVYRGALLLGAFAFLCKARPMLATLAKLFSIGPDGAHDPECEDKLYDHYLRRSDKSICSYVDRIKAQTGSWDRFFNVACRIEKIRPRSTA
jgi:hypothetical protein